MAQVKLLTSFVIRDKSEAIGYRSHSAGETIKLEADEAERMVAGGLAEHAGRNEGGSETATRGKNKETAASRKSKPEEA